MYENEKSSSIPILATILVAATSFIINAMAAESDVPEPDDCPDRTDPLCPPATSENQTGNTTAHHHRHQQQTLLLPQQLQNK